MNKIVLPPLPEPDIVVDNAGRAWSASMNREVDGIRYYAASHLHAHAAAVSAAKDAEISGLRDALRGALPWVVTQVVACNGLKCREDVCMSCNSDAEDNAQRACDAYCVADAALKEKTS